MGVAEEGRGGQAAADVPERGGERTAGVVLGKIGPAQADQPVAGQRVGALEDQIGQEGL
jgi:hypothetical protein